MAAISLEHTHEQPHKKRKLECKECKCNICDDDEVSVLGKQWKGFSCSHYFCMDCLAKSLSITICQWLGKLPNDIRLACPGASNGKKCSFPLEVEFVHAILFEYKASDNVIEKAFLRLDDILRVKCLKADFPEYRICPKCNDGVSHPVCSEDKWATCQCCDFEYCPICELGSDVHQGKTCLELQTPTGHIDSAKPCPACQSLIEKTGGCDHITCKNCSYEFCWLCNASYYAGHLRVHDITRIPVQVPGQSIPLQITTTQHTLYKLQGGAQEAKNIQPSTVQGQDIPQLFRDYQVVKMVKIATTDPKTGIVTQKDGILMKKNNPIVSNNIRPPNEAIAEQTVMMNPSTITT